MSVPRPAGSVVRDRLLPLLRWAGVDRVVVFGIAARVWQFAAAPITLLLIVRHMTPEVQGYYYTFASLLALQSFVELSLSVVVLNFASHEWTHLAVDESGQIIGDRDALSRLVSLGQFIFKWYAFASVLFVAGVGTAGYVFFSQVDSGVTWKGPWMLLVVLTGLVLWALPFSSLLEGCNQIANVQKFRVSQTVLSSLALWGVLLVGGGLWAAAAATAVMVLRDVYLLGFYYRRWFLPFLSEPTGARMRWKAEIWPVQWRLAVVALGNYFAFSLFTPVMFYYHSAATAGQMGMTWTLALAIQGVALMWVYAKVPMFGTLVAQRDYSQLDKLWLRTSRISLVVVCLGGAGLCVVVWLFNLFDLPYKTRLLAPLPTALLSISIVGLQVLNCVGAYLRAHRQEPLMAMSLSTSFLIGLAVWLLGSRFGPLGASLGLAVVVTAIGVPWATAVLLARRAEWHQTSLESVAALTCRVFFGPPEA